MLRKNNNIYRQILSTNNDVIIDTCMTYIQAWIITITNNIEFYEKHKFNLYVVIFFFIKMCFCVNIMIIPYCVTIPGACPLVASSKYIFRFPLAFEENL